jgi:hypothetical protein
MKIDNVSTAAAGTTAHPKKLAEKLLEALQAQQDGDTTAIDSKQLPGPKAKAKYAAVDKQYDGVEAEEFTFGGQTWYAVTATIDQASDLGYWFFSKNDVPAGYAEDDR